MKIKKNLTEAEQEQAAQLYREGSGISTVALLMKAGHGPVKKAIEARCTIRTKAEGLRAWGGLRTRKYLKEQEDGK